MSAWQPHGASTDRTKQREVSDEEEKSFIACPVRYAEIEIELELWKDCCDVFISRRRCLLPCLVHEVSTQDNNSLKTYMMAGLQNKSKLNLFESILNSTIRD